MLKKKKKKNVPGSQEGPRKPLTADTASVLGTSSSPSKECQHHSSLGGRCFRGVTSLIFSGKKTKVYFCRNLPTGAALTAGGMGVTFKEEGNACPERPQRKPK